MPTLTAAVQSDATLVRGLVEVSSSAFLSTAEYWPLRDVFQLGPINKFAIEQLRGYLRITYYVGQSLPALGLVMQGNESFTPTSHTYTATLTPRKTADVPAPADVFQDRAAILFKRHFDGAPVVAVAWSPNGDFPATGLYDLKFKAVNLSTGRSFDLPWIEIEVLEPL